MTVDERIVGLAVGVAAGGGGRVVWGCVWDWDCVLEEADGLDAFFVVDDDPDACVCDWFATTVVAPEC